MNKKILKEHQIIDNEINLEYNNVGELLSLKAHENKEKNCEENLCTDNIDNGVECLFISNLAKI